jgi:hypothetical protein
MMRVRSAEGRRPLAGDVDQILEHMQKRKPLGPGEERRLCRWLLERD